MSPMSDQLIPADYAGWLADLKSRIQRSRTQAALAVNQELVRLYHPIGSEILARKSRQGWGAKVVDRLAADLRAAFPDMKGLSASNLKYMRYFAELCPSL
jgi:predicted nuclease of restriction endonuclease-like (RecB) superfamily